MDNKSLEKNLANIERELLNLQTAHDIPLGSVKYIEMAGADPASILYGGIVYAFYMCINVAQGERLNPFIETYINREEAFEVYFLKSSTYADRYCWIVYSTDNNYVHWKIVTTSKLDYFFASSTQEAEDWLGGYL